MAVSDYILDDSTTVGAALAHIQAADNKVVFIVDVVGRLCGCVTDGDVRRFLLSGKHDITAPVMDCATKTPLFYEGFSEAEARRIMKEREIKAIPMTRDGIIHAIVFEHRTEHAEFNEISAPVIIMAGGLGTRLYPYTTILPKALIPVGAKTITEHIIERFKKFGSREVTLVVNHKRQLIKSYFAEVNVGCDVKCVDEDEPLGTGGGLYMFKGQNMCPAFVTNCDSVIEADYSDIMKKHIDNNDAITMVCAKTKVTMPYGVIDIDETGAVSEMREKPSYEFLMNTGFYVISEAFLNEVKDHEFQPMTDIIARCKEKGMRIGTYVIDEGCFVDIGQLDDLKNAADKIG